MLVVGGIIGSGIFLNPAIVAQRVGSGRLILLTWALGAGIALLGAFIFAELGARKPDAGGGYVYLRDAFGPLPAFLYGWALLLAIASGAAAAVAVTFASYAAPLLRPRAGERALAGGGAIALLSVVNASACGPALDAERLHRCSSSRRSPCWWCAGTRRRPAASTAARAPRAAGHRRPPAA